VVHLRRGNEAQPSGSRSTLLTIISPLHADLVGLIIVSRFNVAFKVQTRVSTLNRFRGENPSIE